MSRTYIDRFIDKEIDKLDVVKVAYDKADGSRNKDQLKKEWYDKIKSIAAQIRQD